MKEQRLMALPIMNSSKSENECIPSLHECTDAIKNLGYDRSKSGSKHTAQLFTSCLGFLAHIHLDRITIEQDGRTEFPSAREIPAFSLLLKDRKLFKIFLAMLRSKSLRNDTATPPIISRAGSFGLKKNAQSANGPQRISKQKSTQHLNGESKKRSLTGSISGAPGKMAKMMRSPHTDRKEYVKGAGLGTTMAVPTLSSNTTSSSSSVTANFAVLSVITFYSVFQYLDQWPTIFIKIFAEDCFGSRIWVDDERCHLFVQNLMLVCEHDTSSNKSEDIVTSEDVDKYLKFCNTFLGDIDENCTPEKSPHQPAHIDTMKRKVRTISTDATKLVNAVVDPEGDEENALNDASGSSQSRKRKRANDGDMTSMSGEDASKIQISMMTNSSQTSLGNKNDLEPGNQTLNISPTVSQSNSTIQASDWWCAKRINLSKVQTRFSYANKILANTMIGEALSQRLDVKVKQNSSLLSTLPNFISVPVVRKLASSHLEKWLQSPALSGLARKLFSHVVSGIQNVDPPLQEDVTTIKNILSMKLKANQFNIHIEKIIEIVRNIPTSTVCHQVILYFLTEELKIANDKEMQVSLEVSGELKMLEAILMSITPSLAYSGLASALLSILDEEDEEINSRSLSIEAICRVVGSISSLLGEHYDGYLLVDAMLNRSNVKMKKADFFLISRLVFECITLMVPTEIVNSMILQQSRMKTNRNLSNGIATCNHDDLSVLSSKLLDVKKVVLSWCLNRCTDIFEKKQSERNSKQKLNEPDFSSILDGETAITEEDESEGTLSNIMKCLLFLTKSSSEQIFALLRAELTNGHDYEAETLTEEKTFRIQACMKYGCDIDNDVFRIIVKSVISGKGPMNAKDAICLIEQMLNNCIDNEKAAFLVDDCDVIWDLYKLTEYTPRIPQSSTETSIPKLACPGLWWRVTAIALILCGKSPQKLGAEMWKASPTIQALIKMVTSSKFRFPTADCNEIERDRMRAGENNVKEKEYEIAELLFLPENGKSPSKPVTVSVTPEPSLKKGSRTSARQRAKQARILEIRQEKEKAREMAEAQRRKQKLRKAQKSIMLFDPRSEARKPRKESVQLLFSVDSSFNLAHAFKACIEPDFILATIGSSSRDSIERAYDWLIPTISSSADIINRLPPSASCFLLLRAYGAEGSENSQLLDLSSPLLKHVNDSITGDFGHEGAQRAADILFFDLADKDSDKRRCARRVLQESLGKLSISANHPKFASSEFSWLLALTETKHATSLVSRVITRLVRALDSERGKVLRAYIMALDYFSKMNIELETGTLLNLASSVCNLLSSRPQICIAAMDRFADLRAIMIRVVRDDFKSRLKKEINSIESNGANVLLSIPSKDDVLISLSLLRASLVLIGSWNETSIPPKNELMDLVEYFIPAQSEQAENINVGAASATLANTKKQAVSIEDWVILAKSHCELIARRSVLSAPNIFLPRLLLCCGLPRSSFTTIIKRLDKLGENALDIGKCFRQLLSASASGEWGFLSRNALARILLGRISAYINLLRNANKKCGSVLDAILPSCFISWLETECGGVKQKLSSKRRALKQTFNPAVKISEVLNEDDQDDPMISMSMEDNCSQFCNLDDLKNMPSKFEAPDIITKEVIAHLLRGNNFGELDKTLKNVFDNCFMTTSQSHSQNSILDDISSSLIIEYRSLGEERPPSLSRLMLQWIPLLTKQCDHLFWEVFFQRDINTKTNKYDFENMILTRCLASWSTNQVVACQLWILNEVKSNRTLRFCIKSFLRCFIHKIAQTSTAGIVKPSSDEMRSFLDVLGPKDRTESAVKLGLLGAQQWSIGTDSKCNFSKEPDWMSLLLLIGSIDKKHLDLMSGIIISKLPSNSWEGKVLPATLLKLYASYPTNMNLGGGKIRDVLMKATGEIPNQWLEWKTPLDCQLLSALSSLSIHSIHRQQQLIFDLTKKHPLIAVKYLKTIAEMIAFDADVSMNQDVELRVRQNCRHMNLLAQSDRGEIQVRVLHWGVNYTEPLWLSILDIIASFPEQVIYTSGWLMGLNRIFNLCLKLLYIQHDIDRENMQRLKNKFVSIFQGFKSSNHVACTGWLETKLVDFKRDKVKNILTVLGVTFE